MTSVTPSAPASAGHTASTASYVVRLAMVFIVGGILLRAADAVVPGWLGEPRAAVRYGSVQAAERDLGTRLLVPAVFPDRLVWPPQDVLLTPGADRPVRLTFTSAAGPDVACVIAQTLDGTAELPAGLLPAGTIESHASIARDPDDPVVVQLVRTANGVVWREATVIIQNRRVVIRLIDTDDALLIQMVRSLRRGRV